MSADFVANGADELQQPQSPRKRCSPGPRSPIDPLPGHDVQPQAGRRPDPNPPPVDELRGRIGVDAVSCREIRFAIQASMWGPARDEGEPTSRRHLMIIVYRCSGGSFTLVHHNERHLLGYEDCERLSRAS